MKSVSVFNLTIRIYSVFRSADLNIDEVQYGGPTEFNKLYPVVIDTFRLVIIQHQRQFKMDTMFTLLDIYIFFGFSVYLMFSYIVRKLLFEEQDVPHFLCLAVKVLYVPSGLARSQHHRYLSLNIATAFYYFYAYVHFVSYSAQFTSLLTNSRHDPRITRLNTIRHSKHDIYVTASLLQSHPNIDKLVIERLREPIQITTEELQQKMKTTDRDFVVIYNDHSFRAILSNMENAQKYYYVSETFGESIASHLVDLICGQTLI